jgi:hypothetical protein
VRPDARSTRRSVVSAFAQLGPPAPFDATDRLANHPAVQDCFGWDDDDPTAVIGVGRSVDQPEPIELLGQLATAARVS